MFGFGGKNPKDDDKTGSKELNVQKGAAAESKNPKKGNESNGSGKSVHGFDPVSLERAAKAAKDLDNSRNAKDALKMISQQELTKQKEAETERAKFMAYKEELALKRIAEETEAAERTLEKQTMHERQRAEYKDQLERKRMVDQINAQRVLQEEERKKQEESLRRQEEIRRKTLEYEAELRQQTEMAKVKAETEGRILQERKNHDLHLETKKLEATEYRETVLEGLKIFTSTVGNGLQGLLGDQDRLRNTAITITGIAFGIYTAKVTTSLTGKFIEAKFGKPSLVRETSRRNFLQLASSPYSTVKNMLKSTTAEAALKDVILSKDLDNRLKRVAVSTSNTIKNRAPYRHMLLHGPPGTGKTMFAKGLAKESGMHYAIMTGGDVAPLGRDAVTEIHKVFDWANATNKGVLLFVDEADAFLRKRSNEKISEDMRNALNAFLYRTGEASNKFMVVYASNQPEQFDWAINDRIDEMVEFRLPGFEERLRMIIQYMDKYLLHPPMGSKVINVVGIDETVLRSVATVTEGYSGREISKLAIAWQAAAYGTANATIDKALLEEVLAESKNSKKQKSSWLSKEELGNLVRDA